MTIAVLYICTGKYDVFWQDFYKSAQEFFYPDDQKDYFVLTDSPLLLKDKRVHSYFQKKVGWPYDTLLRYNWICTIQDRLRDYDYCFFINANALFLKRIDSGVIPYPTKEIPYVFSIHVRNYDDFEGKTFNPERNPLSTAYVPLGTKCRAHSGGFWGGTSEAFIEMCCTLRDRIAEDLSNGIIAIWHDQSHLIKYATEVPHINVRKGVVASEEYADLNVAAIIYRDKTKYGGNDALREVSIWERIKHLPRKTYKKMLSALSILHLDRALRKTIQTFKKRKEF